MGLVITPGITRTEINQVEQGINSLVRDVIGSITINPPDDFRKGLSEFALEWKTFFNENQDTFSQGLSGVYAQVQDYKRRLEDWKTKYTKLGGKVSAGKLKVDKGLLPNAETMRSIKWVGAGLVAVGGLGALIYIMRK